MDISSSTTTVLSQVATEQSYNSKMGSIIKDQMEMVGQQALQLIESATPRPVDPSSPVGQVIDTYA